MTDKEIIADLRQQLKNLNALMSMSEKDRGAAVTYIEDLLAELAEARKKKRELELAFCNCEELERFGKHAPWCVVNKVLSGKPKGGE